MRPESWKLWFLRRMGERDSSRSTYPSTSRPTWLETLKQNIDYLYLAGIILVLLLSAYILVFE